jgi:hypothetical protein
MLCAARDPAHLPPAPAAESGDRCSDLEMHVVANAGQWMQHESSLD